MSFQNNDEWESPDQILVLFRVADKSVGKIRVFTDDCELDAGGLPVHWLTNVKPKESINLLASFVGATEEKAQRRKSEAAITAIALHADSAADPMLEKFVDPKRPEEVRTDRRNGHRRRDRKRSRNRREEEGGLCLEPASEGRRSAEADRGGAQEPEQRSAQRRDVLARPVKRPPRAGLL